MKLRLFLMCFMASIHPSFAKSFGVVGEVFQVNEKSFLELIQERLRALDLDALNQSWRNRVAEHANRPKPLELDRTNITKIHYYVPEVTLSQNIHDAKGNILFSKGTRVNTLAQMPNYKPCWLFFNADDEAQLRWVEKQHCSNPKLILTGGAIKTAEDRLQASIYFDQAGRISNQLGIKHVPAKVSRVDNKLVINEQAIKENGDAL